MIDNLTESFKIRNPLCWKKKVFKKEFILEINKNLQVTLLGF